MTNLPRVFTRPAAFAVLLAVALLVPPTAQAQEAPPPAATAPAAASTCEPTCRVGFTCVAGKCQSLCNPPCGPGQYCTEQRMCALVHGSAPPRQAAPGDPEELEARDRAALRVQERALARQRARAEREVRLGMRETPRLTLAGGFAYQQLVERVESDGLTRHAATRGGVISLGWRKNFHRLFGVMADAHTMIGKARVADRSGMLRDDTFALNLGVGGGAYFSTPWRLYFGPTASIDYHLYGKETLTMFGRPYALNPDGPLHGSLGAEAGLLFLDREQVDVSVRFAVGLPEALPQAFVTLRFHFLPQSQ